MRSTPLEGTYPDRPPRSALVIVWLVVFIDLLGFGIVLPVMPRQAEPYLQGLSPELRGACIGVLFSSFSLMQFVFAPVWGRISDRIGRKPVLLISLGGSVAFYALYGVAVSLPAAAGLAAVGWMLAARVGAGIAGASVGVAAAVIADCTPPERRARGMALIGIAFGAGFTLGPLIAYFGLAVFDRQPWGVGALASGLSLLALLLAVAIFRETRMAGSGAATAREFFSLRRTVQVLRLPQVGRLILVYFLAICAFAQFEATLALLTGAAFGLSDEDNFLVFATVGAVLLVAGGAYRPLVRRIPEERMLRAGLVLMVAGLAGVAGVAAAAVRPAGAAGAVGTTGEGGAAAVVRPAGASGAAEAAAAAVRPAGPATHRMPLFYLAVAGAVTGFACVNPSVAALISRRTDPARQGEVLGVNQGFAALGRIIGPFVGSVLFQIGSLPILPYGAGVVLLLLAAGLAWSVCMPLPSAAPVRDGPSPMAEAARPVPDGR